MRWAPAGTAGPQGPQGKIGDTGDQGPQGKIGDTGDQGIQGKVGDTGDQGIQGKVGATGPQGIQGKVGPAGADGADGIGTNLLCFGTDQTIGSQGKFIGLGQQAGDHDTVGVISPFLARAEVVKLVVKVSQGNSPRDGDAQLFHDAVTAGGGQLGGNCALDSSPGDFRTVCSILINAAPLTLLDSLSVFVVTDSGSFEGASACVLIDPGP